MSALPLFMSLVNQLICCDFYCVMIIILLRIVPSIRVVPFFGLCRILVRTFFDSHLFLTIIVFRFLYYIMYNNYTLNLTVKVVPWCASLFTVISAL